MQKITEYSLKKTSDKNRTGKYDNFQDDWQIVVVSIVDKADSMSVKNGTTVRLRAFHVDEYPQADSP